MNIKTKTKRYSGSSAEPPSPPPNPSKPMSDREFVAHVNAWVEERRRTLGEIPMTERVAAWKKLTKK